MSETENNKTSNSTSNSYCLHTVEAYYSHARNNGLRSLELLIEKLPQNELWKAIEAKDDYIKFLKEKQNKK